MTPDLSGAAMLALEAAKTRVAGLGADLAQAPEEFQRVVASGSAVVLSGEGVRSFAYVLILFVAGCGLEWLYWTYARAPLRALETIAVTSPRHAFRLGLRRLALMGSGLLLFTLATLAASAAFRWPRGVQETVVGAVLFVLVLRLAWIAVSVLLAPGRPRLCLVPVEQREVRWLAVVSLALAGLAAFGSLAPAMFEQVAAAPHTAGALRFSAAALGTLLLVGAAFAFLGETSPAVLPGTGRRLPQFPRSIVVALMIVGVFVLWLIGSSTIASISAIAAAVVLAQMGLRAFVFHFWQGEIDADAANPEARDAFAADPSLVPSIVLSGARFLVTLAGLAACALTLQVPLAHLAESPNVLVRFGFHLLSVAALVLFAHVVWILVSSTIDHRLKRIGPPDPHAMTNPNARLLTLLPLLRVTAAVFIVGMLVLSSLWALGIEITPLLAGAGVIGLALGFGAQALVRDVIAGIFFLAEDAFRVGEYIESGATTKGTVERITLRTVALRHHNGPLHFVPYGSLGTVRNNSRDWVIEKFNLPLPIDVDSERIRKLIKKIGQEMLTDPDVGHMLREPLKSKLARIDPGVKVFRCKFRTAPGNQFDVRAQALKRIEAELRAIGIGFASGTQTVIVERQGGILPAG